MENKYIALTFDDGPNTVTTPQVLEMLKKHNVTGSCRREHKRGKRKDSPWML